MIIVGIYPDQICNDMGTLKAVNNEIFTVLPRTVIIHLLPFQVSCGDGGFAINDWYTVDEIYGTWADIEDLASKRQLIIDGVFNHVGIDHKWVKYFCKNPKKYANCFFVNTKSGLESPRGQKADQNILTTQGMIEIRQTHTNKTIDINLENSMIINEIDKYLTFLKKKKISGIRLDAVGYYKKGSLIRHNEGAETLANSIADLVKKNGFYTIAQLDCDKYGLAYFSKLRYKDVAIYDFSYSAYLCSALVSGEVDDLCNHLKSLSKINRVIIYAPRTHDGILLKSHNFTEICISRLCDFAKSRNIKVREIHGNIYELNCSLPFLLNVLHDDYTFQIIKMTIVFTGILKGIAYFYYPYIVGFIPELVQNPYIPSRFPPKDPRTLNRIPIDNRYVIDDSKKKELFDILKRLSDLHDYLSDELIWGSSSLSFYNHVIKVSSANGKVIGYFNFSSYEQPIKTMKTKNYEVFFNSGKSEALLTAYDYVIYKKCECD